MEDYPQAKNAEEASKRHEEIKSNPDLLQCAKDQTAFLNIFFSRMWHDLHGNKDFIEFLRENLNDYICQTITTSRKNYTDFELCHLYHMTN